MPDSNHAGWRWRRIAGTLLFEASFVAATLGIARLIFGDAINAGPGIPLGAGGPEVR